MNADANTDAFQHINKHNNSSTDNVVESDNQIYFIAHLNKIGIVG
jgi:hypothetical protein